MFPVFVFPLWSKNLLADTACNIIDVCFVRSAVIIVISYCHSDEYFQIPCQNKAWASNMDSHDSLTDLFLECAWFLTVANSSYYNFNEYLFFVLQGLEKN